MDVALILKVKNTFPTLITALFLALTFYTHAQDAGAEPSSVQQAIQQLSDDVYENRELATMYLWEKGGSILPTLEENLKNDDPEIATRVRTLIRNIRLGILADTPKEIILLVERYQKGSYNEKRDVFTKLRDRKAYRQLLHLYEMEQSASVKGKLTSYATNAALLAAHAALSVGNDEEALAYLLLAPAEEEGMRAAADYYRIRGQLDEQIKLAEESDKPNAKRWKLALLRAKGDLPAALQLAEEMQEVSVVAALRVLQGDPVPYLEYSRANLTANPWKTWYLDAAHGLWTGKPSANSLQKIVNEIRESENVEAKRMIASALFLLGESAKGLDLLSEALPEMLYRYYESSENLTKALEIYQITGREDVVSKTRSLLGIDEEVPESFGNDRTLDVFHDIVLPIAALYETRGDRTTARQILDEPLRLLKERNENNWVQVVISLFDSAGISCGELAAVYAEEAKAEDGVYPREMVRKLIEHNEDLRDLLEDVDPDWRIEQLMVIAGHISDRSSIVESFEGKALKIIETKKPLAKKRALTALINAALAGQRGSFLRASQWHEKLGLPKDKILSWYHQVMIFSKQWEKIKPYYEELYKNNPHNPSVLVNYGALLNRLGEKKRGDELIKRAESLSLGNPKTLLSVAANLNLLGEKEKAYEYYRRVFMTANPGSDEWRYRTTGVLYELSAKRGQYGEAAALLEVYSSVALDNARFVTLGARVARQYNGMRGKVMFFRGMDLLEKGDAKRAVSFIKDGHKLLRGAGYVADEMFPAIRNKIPRADYLSMFRQDVEPLLDVMEAFPDSANVHNSYAWLCSRAMVDLALAEKAIDKSLSLYPNQAPYLDTKAEVEFANNRRKSAVKWSDEAIWETSSDPLIWEQNHRFKKGDFPTRLK